MCDMNGTATSDVACDSRAVSSSSFSLSRSSFSARSSVGRSQPLGFVRGSESEPATVGTTAMTLATGTRDGGVSARVVLLRGLDERGLTFFTNRESRKGRDLAENPRAALVLHWWQLGRQARVEGEVVEVAEPESDAYWQSRPLGSRIAASISASGPLM